MAPEPRERNEKSYLVSYRAGVAQAAADEAAMLAPPSPPPEPAANTPPPPRSKRTGAAAPKPLKPAPKKAAAGASPKLKSKPVAASGSSDTKQQKLVLPDADPSPQPAAEAGISDALPGETVDDTPAELSAAIAAWEQFDEQAKGLLVGRAQADNMVQLLSSQVEGKRPEQVIMEVVFLAVSAPLCSIDNNYMCACFFGGLKTRQSIHKYLHASGRARVTPAV